MKFKVFTSAETRHHLSTTEHGVLCSEPGNDVVINLERGGTTVGAFHIDALCPICLKNFDPDRVILKAGIAAHFGAERVEEISALFYDPSPEAKDTLRALYEIDI